MVTIKLGGELVNILVVVASSTKLLMFARLKWVDVS